MKVTREVRDFIEDVSTTFPELKKLFISDIKTFQNGVTDGIIAGRIHLENSWNGYIVSDIDVIYEEDMLEFVSKLDMFGIRDKLPGILSSDIGTIIIYRFSSFDAYGNVSDIATGYHFGLIQNRLISDKTTKNRKIFVYN